MFPGKVSGELKDSIEEAFERHYDSVWSRPSLLLDLLSKFDFINRDILSATIGKLVLFSGHVQLFDVNLLQNSWSAISKLGMKASGKNYNSKLAADIKNIGELLKCLPGDPQIYIKDPSGILAWSILEREYFTGSPTSIALSNGSFLNDKWSVLGILDGTPSCDDLPRENFSSIDFADPMAQMMESIKSAAGKDPSAYSITPILVFRQVHNQG